MIFIIYYKVLTTFDVNFILLKLYFNLNVYKVLKQYY